MSEVVRKQQERVEESVSLVLDAEKARRAGQADKHRARRRAAQAMTDAFTRQSRREQRG